MSSRPPFFEPRHPPEQESREQPRFVNHPWMPPLNVVPVVVPLNLDVVTSDLVVVRVPEVRAFDRGMLVEVEAWLHPDAAARVDGSDGLPDEPRVGLLLGDGTRLGAGETGPSPDAAPEPPDAPTEPLFVQYGAGSGELRANQSLWVAPVPEGNAELVVAWDALHVPETYSMLDLAAVREAATRARELWPLPDSDGEEFGWFAYAPRGGTAYMPPQGLATGGDG